ncbi:MAG: hypothetical protein AAFY65_04765 [Pseudomonadota bacterium]
MRYLIFTLPLLAACNGSGTVSDGPDPIAFAGGTPWVCDTGAALRTEQQGSAIGLVLDDGRALSLPRVQSTGGGTTYGADGWVWFAQGDTAILTEQGGQKNCRRASQAEYDEAFRKRQPLIGQDPVAGFNPPTQ